MALQYRLRPIGDSWPGKRTAHPIRSPFGANWGDTLDLLEREVRALKGRDVVMAIEVGERDVRIDGGLRADARVKVPAVILELRAGPDLLSFPCDRFNFWQDNVRAIALALEALRKVDRYGVRSGRQYEGFKKLPGAGDSTVTMDAARAARIISEFADAGFEPELLLGAADEARAALRHAMAKTHPDRHGGSTDQFQIVQTARRVLADHHGEAL